MLIKQNIKNDKIKDEKIKDEKIKDDNIKDNKIEDDKIEDDKIEDDIINFNIPILWIPCIKLRKYVRAQKISKPTIKNHYRTCKNCEINNNNRLEIDFDNKILFNNCMDKDEFDSIINSYLLAQEYSNKKSIINKYEYQNDKINIICIKEDYIHNKGIENNSKSKFDKLLLNYNECLFIIF